MIENSQALMGLKQGLMDLTCNNPDVCRPMSALIFTVLYFVFMVVRHVVIYGWLNRRFARDKDLSEEQRRAIAASAIDLSAILQFVLWIPLGFGAFGLSNFYLFMLPMFQELYDVVYLKFVHERRFAPELVKFVMQHHLISTIARISLAGLAYAFVPVALRQFCFASILLFYCCSIFLITPSALKPFLWGRDNARVVLRLVTFYVVRVCHLVVFSWCIFGIHKGLNLSVWIPVAILATLIYSASEIHSVTNALPRLREDWRRFDRKRSNSVQVPINS
jgi:hypothetical protein